MKILVCVKEVIDPEVPVSSIEIDSNGWKFVPKQGVSTVLNGFDENAIEAAIQLKESIEDVEISVLSLAKDFSMDVIKKPLSMGCQNLFLVKDDILETSDPFVIVNVLYETINKIGPFDLILCGRHASDWDNAQVPIGLAEKLNIDEVYINEKEKLNRIVEICKDLNISMNEIAYIGDDLNDLEIVKLVGFAATPADGIKDLQKIVDYVCKNNGGHGAFREIADLIVLSRH